MALLAFGLALLWHFLVYALHGMKGLDIGYEKSDIFLMN